MNKRNVIVWQKYQTHEDYAFPNVCAWVRDNDISLNNLAGDFPSQATVYFHISKALGQMPARGEYLYCECTGPDQRESAHWSIAHVHDDLYEVFLIPDAIFTVKDLVDWLDRPFPKSSSVFGKTSSGYLYNAALGLIGPFKIESNHQLKPVEGRTKIFKNAVSSIMELGDARNKFIIEYRLPHGEIIPLTGKAAAASLLKALRKSEEICTWLGRENRRELVDAVGAMQNLGSFQWVFDDVKNALSTLDTLDLNEKSVISLLVNRADVRKAVESAWQQENEQLISAKTLEIEQLSAAVTRLTNKSQELSTGATELEKRLSILRSQEESLGREITDAPVKARAAFDAELANLSANPERVAVLKAALGENQSASSSATKPAVVLRDTKQLVTIDSRKACADNLVVTGLLRSCAEELAGVISVATRLGQPITFLGASSEYTGEAVATALSHDGYLRLDCPAGLLDPYNWDDVIDSKTSVPLVIHGTHRSDLGVVLGSLKHKILERLREPAGEKPVLLLTRSVFSSGRVDTDLSLYGPILDESCFELGRPKSESWKRGSGGQAQSPPVQLAEESALSELLKPLDNLGNTSFGGFTRFQLQTAYSILTEFDDNEEKVELLLFKYWILPRLDQDLRQEWSEAYRKWLEKDVGLKTRFLTT